MKKITSALLAILMCLILCYPALAVETSENGSAEIEIQIFNSLEEYEVYLSSLYSDISPQSEIKRTDFIPVIVRKNGENDETCQFYTSFAGDIYVSAIRFKKVTVKSTSILFAETYETFGDGSKYTSFYFTATTIGSVLVGEMEIPTDVDRVKVKSSSFGAYILDLGDWFSSVEWNHSYDIGN